MKRQPRRVFLDTNVYIVGAALPGSVEEAVLIWCGYDGSRNTDIEVVVSDALFRQIRGVARRLRGKDWAGEILMQIWRHMKVRFVVIDNEEAAQLRRSGEIPSEDAEIFMAAWAGNVDCFVSANRELVRAAAARTGAFACLAPKEFVERYLES